jgi:hypothetical protein
MWGLFINTSKFFKIKCNFFPAVLSTLEGGIERRDCIAQQVWKKVQVMKAQYSIPAGTVAKLINGENTVEKPLVLLLLLL